MKKLLLTALIGLVIFLMIQYPMLMLNPGELVSGHQKLNKQCFACHEPFWGISNNKCIACHPLDQIGISRLSGSDSLGKARIPHQNLKNQQCVSCHTDHRGINPEISISRFDHESFIGENPANCFSCHPKPTDVLHQSLASTCGNCHKTSGWKNDVQFSHDMIQLDGKNNCQSCHQKPLDNFHQSLTGNCANCHGFSKWKPANFEHAKYFVLDQNHNAQCNTCHEDQNFETYTCYGCHEHSEASIRNKHQEEGIYNYSNCVQCHRSGNEHEMEGGHGGEGGEGGRGGDDD